ncbi:speckle-type POZ protein-like [Aphidius gifuensis]|uniref:speckle-type POZ protein-like n=1 Tax=Aphidius gifuensis TaxID=684658 RepID=UPI001CDCAE4C|nr:speckle-type POZ protein-like [Aphidius gifuensis]
MSIAPRQSFTTEENQSFTFEYDWTIKNFVFHDDKIESSEFSSGLANINDKWCLKIFPKVILDDTEFVSVQLKLLDCAADVPEIVAHYKVSILTLNNEEVNAQSSLSPLRFSSKNTSAIVRRFVKREDLFGRLWESTKLLPNDSLTILCEIKLLVDDKTIESYQPVIVNDHKKLINDLGQLLSSGLSSDFTFKVKGKSFQVIKGIMAARSCVFRKMFEGNDTNEHTVSDIEAPVFEELLRYIYTDEAPRIDELPKQLLAVADRYQLEELKNIHKLRDVVATGPFQVLKASHGRVFMAVLEAIAEIK